MTGADDMAAADETSAHGVTGAGGVTVSIAELAAAYRNGTLSPVEVTQACLDRIAAVDGEIGAFATVTAERALDDARAAERALRDDPHGARPLLGVPVGVKDVVDTAGIETAAGTPALAGRVPATSATVWRRLEQAGAVLIGKTRTHELAAGVRTPPTRNPWDTGRIPGGSSGGSAAALAAGMCVGAVGSDTAGSIRIPSALCGTVGIKPTFGLCPTDGVRPLAPSLDHVGPMARTVADVATLLAVMTRPVAAAGATTATPGGTATVAPEGSVVLEGTGTMTLVDAGTGAGTAAPDLRIGLVRGDALVGVAAATALDRAVTALAGSGAVVRDATVPPFADAEDIADDLLAVEAVASNADLLASAADRLGAAARAKLLRWSSLADDRVYARATERAAALRERMGAVFADHDLLLLPSVPVVAPRHDERDVRIGGTVVPFGTAACHNMSLADVTRVPALALPAGTVDGLPVGVQLLGPSGSEALLLAVGAALVARLPASGSPAGP